ncbi:hypothetical protein TRAPUB_4381 [Trametes pubescens]|uniref:Uncharacterized protein n=1 Tax=Trametes pubescens TaxID=154538 RepID=A0A1M2W7A8_TRAPU|nr:hypothetical protein TRAPUB_4381 [Trametes pubescens]
MSFSSNDNLVLVAPRPVRLASGAAPFPFHSPVAHRPRSRAAILSAATDAFDRLMLAEDSGDHHEHRAPELSEKDSLSPRTSPRSELGTRPSPAVGYAILASSVVFLLVGSYAVFFSAFFPETGVWLLDVLARDTLYKYLAIMLIPAGTGFVIANWVGWQYYRNS